MHPIEEKSIDVQGFKLAYTETGPKDGRVVFCVHGLLSNGRDYDFLAQHLAGLGYRTIAIDLPGRGKSDPFHDESLYSVTNYFPFCFSLIGHVCGNEPFDWLGVSLGGMLGMSLHAVEGVNMARLILVDVGPEISGDALNMVAQLAKAPAFYHSQEAAVIALKKRCASWGIHEQSIWDHLAAHNIIQDKNGMFTLHYDKGIARAMPEVHESIQFWEVWEQIKQPILLIRGGLSMLLPVHIAQKMKSTYQGKQFDEVVFQGCGHVPNLMQGDHIGAVARWLGDA